MPRTEPLHESYLASSQPKRNSLKLITDIERFFEKASDLTDLQWQKLIETKLYPLDWPKEYGGFEWRREIKLAFVRRLIENGCPLFPESLTLIAPLLIRTNRPNLLNTLSRQISGAQLVIKQDSICIAIFDEHLEIASGKSIDQELAMGFSPLYQLYELRSTLRHITTMNDYWGSIPVSQVGELNIQLEALESLYLQRNESADLHIALKCNSNQLTCYSLLSDAMGYYALLNPDPMLTANEPIPFSTERNHLNRLRHLVGRNEMVQHDRLVKLQLELLS